MFANVTLRTRIKYPKNIPVLFTSTIMKNLIHHACSTKCQRRSLTSQSGMGLHFFQFWAAL